MFNTVAFIESIEPDFEYQGLEGAMSLVVENAENFALINDVIDEGAVTAEEDVFTEGVIGAAAKYVRKAIEWIIKNIKKAIAKLKSLFLSLVHKLKMAYLSAMKSIGKFAAKNLTSKNGGTAKVKWRKLDTAAFSAKCDEFCKQIEKTTDDMIGATEHVSAFANDNDDDLRQQDYLKDKGSKLLKDKIKGMIGKKEEDGSLFKYMEIADANTASLKALYDNCLVKKVNAVYKSLMKNNDKLLKAAHKAEKDISKENTGEYNFNKNGVNKDGKKHISKSRLIIKRLNAAVNNTITLNTMLFSAVYRVSVFALHQNIKATVYAIKRAVMGDDAYKYKKDKEGAKAAVKQQADERFGESANIEDILA